MARNRLDGLIYPTSQVAAPTMEGRKDWATLTFPTNTLIASQAWSPAMSVPAGFTAGGLPVGLEFVAAPYDMGESYGRWRLGDDEGAMPWISSANIACGFHAGDPSTMRASARLAIDHDVAIGAHVGFPGLLGFGRRLIEVTPDEVRDYTTYQIGALAAIVRSEGGRLAHVKPHGALYGLCSSSEEHASAVAAAIASLEADLPLLLLSPEIAPAVQAHGVRLVVEAFPDLDYEPNARLVIEPVKRAWDPERVGRASRAHRPAPPHRRDRRQRPRRGRTDPLPSWRRTQRAGDRTGGSETPSRPSG